MYKVFAAVLLHLLFLKQAFSMPVGFNQAWFHNHYSTQYLDGVYDETEVERIFELNRKAGSTNLRLWFFESANFPMIQWKDGKVVSLRADFIKNVLKTLSISKKYNVKVYMTFLDAHAFKPHKLSRSERKLLKNIYRGRDFLENAIGPLLRAIDEAALAKNISGIDLANEVDTIVNRGGFRRHWKGAGQMLCEWRSFIRSFDSFKSTPVTFSLRLHPLLSLPGDLFSDKGPLACADFLDFHSYSDKGKIYRCNDLKEYSLLGKKKLILGEFGQSFFNHRYDNELQKQNTVNYLKDAVNCGFSEALAWRLSDIRPGANKEARYSFEAFGSPRPAFSIIQEHNSSQTPRSIKIP